MYKVYILQSKINNRYYVGYTSDIDNRLRHHNSGANRSTRNGVPWEVVYTETFQDKSSAWKREQQIKKYKSGKAFRQLVSQHGEVA